MQEDIGVANGAVLAVFCSVWVADVAAEVRLIGGCVLVAGFAAWWVEVDEFSCCAFDLTVG